MSECTSGEGHLKLTLAKWIESVALDDSISFYAFRVAQRLGSKVKTGSFQTSILKCRNKADSAAIALLIERGHLVDVPPSDTQKRLSVFCLVGKGRGSP